MSQDSPESAELAKLHEGFIEAFRNNDFDALGAFYGEGAVLLPPGRPLVVGRADILAYWQGAQAILDLRFDISEAALLASDVLREVGKIEMLVRGQGRDTTRREAKYVTIWQKQGGGWKMTTSAWSGVGGEGGGRRRGGGGGGGRRGRPGGGGGGRRAGGGGGARGAGRDAQDDEV